MAKALITTRSYGLPRRIALNGKRTKVVGNCIELEPPESNKFLELSDIALGLNKPSDAQKEGCRGNENFKRR
jgi:hypothetical protein